MRKRGRERVDEFLFMKMFRFRFLDQLDEATAGNTPFTLVLDDPAGNSFVQSLADDYKDDASLKIERYTRSFDQNEELGLNDMKVENYEEEEEEKKEDDKKDLQTITEE